MKSCKALLALALAASAAQPLSAADKLPSLYLRCDGNPNNMSAGEGIARFVGAITLLGLFAPPTESPDAEARLFGAEGVDACSQLIDGAKAEGNVARRLPLILARAIHRIEVQDFEGALADVEMARREAAAAKLDGDIYFDRSFGQSLDRIEAAALARLGRVAEAKAKLLAKARAYPFSYFVVGAIEDYTLLSDEVTEDEIEWLRSLTRIQHTNHWTMSARLQLAGRWQEAAEANDSYLDYLDRLGLDERDSEAIAATAAVHFIAGNRERAHKLAADARENFESRKRRGKPDDEESNIIEILDFFEVLDLADKGDLAAARRRYGGRSNWVNIPVPHRLYASRLLRKDAAPEELVGALLLDEDAIRTNRREERLAQMLEADKDNKTLFGRMLPYADVSDFEALSARVWNVRKSKLLGAESEKAPGMFYIEGRNGSWQPTVDAMLLHCALLAKARGKSGFVFWMETARPYYGFVRFGDRGEAGMVPTQYLDADAVIVELRKAIPSPAEFEARKQARKAAAR